MKKTACFMLLTLLFLLPTLTACSAGRQAEPKICERLAFCERDGKLSAVLTYTTEEEGQSTETFSEETAAALLDALLSTEDTVLFKSVQTVLFESALSDARKKELLCALFSRTEFQLQAEVFEKEEVFSPFSPLSSEFSGKKAGTLTAYYRKIMNTPLGKGGGLSLDT